jgi:hypothetical protein
MATIKLSSILSSIHGSHSGSTFRRANHTTVAYARPTARVRPSPGAQAQRLNFSILRARWRDTLTPAQREAWRRFASQASPSSTSPHHAALSGRNSYLQFNLFRLITDLAIQDDAPAIGAITPPKLVRIAFVVPNLYTCLFDAHPLLPGETMILSLTTPWYAQRDFFHGPLAARQAVVINPPRFSTAGVSIDEHLLTPTASPSFAVRQSFIWP